MTEDEVRSLVKLEDRISSEKDFYFLKATEPYSINGSDLQLTFIFHEQKVSSIRVVHNVEGAEMRKGDCDLRYYQLFRLIQAKYGRPDFDPKQVEWPGSYSIMTFFTDKNGRFISFEENIGEKSPQRCQIIISYSDLIGGNPF